MTLIDLIIELKPHVAKPGRVAEAAAQWALITGCDQDTPLNAYAYARATGYIVRRAGRK